MKLVFVGGGAHRVLSIARSTLALPGVLDSGEICICDLNLGRAEAMGRMLLKTPEQVKSGCRITWTASLDEALPGASVVAVIMPAASREFFERADEVSLKHGFISSDNVSPTGALCAVNIAPVILGIARRMECLCPDAWMINFVNPVAVISGMINNHTRIRALGVCAGFINHLSDIPRLFGRDEEVPEIDVLAAGINHLSYIVKGSWKNEDLFTALDRHLQGNWQPPVLHARWNAGARANITRSVSRLARIWRELGVLVFSTEGDGLDHLMYDEAVAMARESHRKLDAADFTARLAEFTAGRDQADRTFNAYLSQDLDAGFWASRGDTDSRFRRRDEDIFVRIFAALAGVRAAKIVTSRPNHGAIAGIKDRHTVEYSQVLFKNEIRPDSEKPFEIPDVVQGITAAFAAHQTLLGDALANEDPRQLAHALVSYPMKPYSREIRALYRELLGLSGGRFAPFALQAIDHL